VLLKKRGGQHTLHKTIEFIKAGLEFDICVSYFQIRIVRSFISYISACSCITWALINDISGHTLAGKSWLDGLLVASRGIVDLLVMLLYNVPDLSRASLTVMPSMIASLRILLASSYVGQNIESAT